MALRRLGLLLALPTVLGLSLTACGTEDDAAPGPSPAGGSGAAAGTAGSGNAGNGGTGAVAGIDGEGGTGGDPGPGGAGAGAGGSAGEGGAGGDGPGIAGDGNVAGEGGEGGQAPLPCHMDLFKFDTNPGVAPSGAMDEYLTPASPTPPAPPAPVQSSTVEWSSTEGVAAAGSGRLNATFGALNEQAQLSLYTPAGAWTCRTKLHAKVKFQSATDLTAINGVLLTINSGPYDNTGRYSNHFTSTSTFALDTWYAIEMPFATASYQSPANTLPDFTDVRSIGIMVQTKTTGATPTPLTLFVDDIWVE
jgi:hypothetical protein